MKYGIYLDVDDIPRGLMILDQPIVLNFLELKNGELNLDRANLSLVRLFFQMLQGKRLSVYLQWS